MIKYINIYFANLSQTRQVNNWKTNFSSCGPEDGVTRSLTVALHRKNSTPGNTGYHMHVGASKSLLYIHALSLTTGIIHGDVNLSSFIFDEEVG